MITGATATVAPKRAAAFVIGVSAKTFFTAAAPVESERESSS
jgi:hypothetical protein